jgi:hypothetical protein
MYGIVINDIYTTDNNWDIKFHVPAVGSFVVYDIFVAVL